MSELFTTPDSIIAYAQVAPEQGVDVTSSGLTYGIPEALKDITVGDRVLVPLGRGNKTVPGFVVQIDDSTSLPQNKIKAITEKDPAGIHLPADLIELARWLSGYYCCPIGMVFGTMLPAAVKHGIGASVQTLVYRNPEKDIKTVKLSKLQKTAITELEKCEQDNRPQVEMRELAGLAGAKSISPIKQLITKGVLKSNTQTIIKAPTDRSEKTAPIEKSAKLVLNDTQQKAVSQLASKVDDGGFGVHLLHGVTGSGKTEVYLQMIEHVFAHRPDSAAIVLVPEIALTPQTVSRFTARFDSVAVMHSALTAAQRHEQWRRIAAGEAKIVIGARSAIFAPLPEIGIIIVDEEHDSSYKQDQLPRYHARDVAVKRGQQLSAQVVLGSATPSLESYYNATVRGSYDLLHLPERVSGFQLPHVQLVDLIEERKYRRGVHLLSRKLEELIGYVKRQGGQTMLLLNRRGYANYVACPDHTCGWMQTCEHCDATMVYHKHQLPMGGSAGGASGGGGGFIRCHHCGNEQLLKPLCPQCGKKITLFGLGTQRVEEEIAKKFPDLSVARMDSDTMRQREDYQRILGQFQKGEIDLLIGTQMIAKGLDFPNVRLVGVISGDTSLHMPDFRAAERTFQLIAQVAGRAGRSSTPGVVVVQTFSINDPTIKLASKHDFITFAQRELEMRQQIGLPPHTRMARVVVRDIDHEKSYLLCKKLTQELARCNQQLGNVVRLRGPMPCPIARIADFHRHQVEMVAPDAGTLQKLMTMLRNERLLISDNRMAVDVDPTVLL
jgi:primosomal protein N' (replication factor Y)